MAYAFGGFGFLGFGGRFGVLSPMGHLLPDSITASAHPRRAENSRDPSTDAQTNPSQSGIGRSGSNVEETRPTQHETADLASVAEEVAWGIAD